MWYTDVFVGRLNYGGLVSKAVKAMRLAAIVRGVSGAHEHF